MALHSKKGFWFQRGSEGAVQVLVNDSDAENASLLREVTLSADEWSGIVSEMAPLSLEEVPASEDEIPVIDDKPVDAAIDPGVGGTVEDSAVEVVTATDDTSVDDKASKKKK